ncbi:MAG: TRAP transporter substrate-binding protein [Pseudomonadota bacterium]
MSSLTLRRSLMALATLGSISLAAAPAAQSEVVMKLASATINDVQHEWQKVFSAKLKERIGDAVTTEIYPASQLGTIPRMLEGVLFGTIESFITPTSFLVGTEPKFEVFDVPALFASPEQIGAVFADPTYQEHLENLALEKGLRVIGAIYNSPILLLSTQPVPDLAAFDGLKVRTFASPLQMEPLASIGASPLPLPLSEVVPALQSGNIDAMLAGMPILVAFKFYDVARFVTDLRLSTVISVNVVSEAWYQAQSPEVQAAISGAGWEASSAVLPFGIANVERTNTIWTEKGGKIIELPADQHAKLLADFRSIGIGIINEKPAVAEELTLLEEVIATTPSN